MITWICSAVSDPDDQEFLIELYEEFHALMFSVARRYNNNWMSCEDIVQESILRIMDKLDVLRSKKRCVQAGYIAMVVRNVAINTLKHEDIVKAHAREVAEEEPTAPTMDEILIARENAELLMQVLQQMPEAEALLLRGIYAGIFRRISCQTDWLSAQERAHEADPCAETCAPSHAGSKERRGTALTRQEQLQEQMEDTVFALLMNEVMQRESAHIWTEYQAEKEAGHDLSVPEDTDRRMRAFIRRQFHRKRHRNARKTILHVMQVSAAVFCVLSIVSATAFASSPIFREDVLHLVEKSTKTGTAYSFSDGYNQTMPSEYTDTVVQSFSVRWLPDGLTFQKEERTQSTIIDTFAAADGRYLTIQKATGAAMTASIDTEDAQTSQTKIHGNTAQVAEKDGMVTVTWTDALRVSIYCVTAQNIDTQDVLKTAEQIQ